jgi:hypothetical protein
MPNKPLVYRFFYRAAFRFLKTARATFGVVG